MQQSESLSRNSNENDLSSSLRLTTPQKSIRRLGLCSQIATGGQHSSPIVFPEKRSKAKSSSRRGSEINSSIPKFTMTSTDDRDKPKSFEHRIDIGGGDEQSDLLGYTVLSGKLVLDKRKNSDKNTSDDTGVADQEGFDAKLTSTALVWGSHMLRLEDVISVSFSLHLTKTQGPRFSVRRIDELIILCPI